MNGVVVVIAVGVNVCPAKYHSIVFNHYLKSERSTLSDRLPIFVLDRDHT